MMRKFGTLREVFETTCSHVEFDMDLARRVSQFQVGFATKNEDHMAFFGGNLLGVQVVRFTPRDRDMFFGDVLHVDEGMVEDAILSVPIIKADRKVSSDTFNQVCIWAIHGFAVSKLPEKIREQAMHDLAVIMCYRFITSLFYSRFRFPAEREVAEATYARLSNKFAIKQYGTWQGVLDARAQDMISKSGIHADAVYSYNDDKAIVNMINDSQGRIRSMINNVYSEYIEVHKQGTRIKTTSLVMEYDGDQIFKDSTRTLTTYIHYSRSIAGDEHGYIKQEILDVLKRVTSTAPPAQLEQVLRWCTSSHRQNHGQDWIKLIELTLVHSFAYLDNNRTVFRETNDLTKLIERLKGVYTSSRSTDPQLLEIRMLAEKLVAKGGSSKNTNVIASVRTALLLYIVIRAYTMSHYSGV